MTNVALGIVNGYSNDAQAFCIQLYSTAECENLLNGGTCWNLLSFANKIIPTRK